MSPVLDPARECVLAQVPMSGRPEVESGVGAAAAAAGEWAEVPVLERARLMFRLHPLLERHTEELARTISAENGKTLRDARAEVTRGLEVLEFAAGMPSLMQGRTLTNVSRGVDSDTRYYPVGVVGCVTPFNFPAMIPLWMLPLAITAGNTVVLKPSEQAPLTAAHLVDLFADAGLPEGVLSLVHGGAEVANALCDAPEVAAISFVGSEAVARHVHARATAAGKRVQALGGAMNFMIALDDAPPVATVNAVFSSAFGNAGQRCLAGSTLLITPEAADTLLPMLAERVANAVIGPGDSPDTELTPVISNASQDRLRILVEEAVGDGAVRLAVGSDPPKPGYYVSPTVLTDVHPGSRAATEELFGPVLLVRPVRDLDEALRIANASSLGNSSSLFTRSGQAARRYQSTIQAGMLGINVGVPAPVGVLPFSGWKNSFYGDLHANGTDAVRFYTRVKTTTTRWPER